MFEKFTDRAKKVISIARQEAQRFNSEFIGTEHILLGIVQESSGVAAKVIKSLNIDVKQVRKEVENLITKSEVPMSLGQLPLSPRAKRVIELANEISNALGHDVVGTEHLLLGLLKEEEGIAAQVLANLGLKLDQVRNMIYEILGVDEGEPANSMGADNGSEEPRDSKRKSNSSTPALDAFSRDLTDMAKDHKLDPVLNRTKEIERVIQILSRRTKNNPVLLGEPGVGKTAIVEGLAQDIINGNVPDLLKNKRIMALDLTLMIAGTKFRGQFEERIKAVMAEVQKNKEIILFIDEIHTLIGAGGAEGAIDAANVLKPSLSRGEIQCIGATTLNEYRKHIEKDGALERRFQTVIVDPPSIEDSIVILKGLRDKYEAHHRVRFTDEALVACVELSTRYINGRFLPDKAIDVMDEAGARVRLQSMTSPINVKELDDELKKLEKEKNEAIALQEFERAAQVRDKSLQVKKNRDKLVAERDQNKELAGTVDVEIIAHTVSMMTGVPLTRIEKQEAERLLHLEDELHKTVVSQNEAASAVARVIRRSRAGLKDPMRPIGSFIFLGPTGVGKTLMAKALAKTMFGDENSLITIDMSEYMEKHNVSRLVGAPPGYVGYEEGGYLTEKIRRRPYAVVLFDEIEKAHGDVFNLLLQIMEEGRLTDSFGRHVDFKNTVIIMTSNVGAHLLKDQTPLGFRKVASADSSYDGMKEMLTGEVEKQFRPEFLNRLDDVIVFKPLERKDLEQIVHLELEKVGKRITKDMKVSLTPAAIEYVLKHGYNPEFGARPLRRSVERLVEDPLSEGILRGEFINTKEIVVDFDNNKLVFKSKETVCTKPS